jgi:hypothetical protein
VPDRPVTFEGPSLAQLMPTLDLTFRR